MCSQAEGSKGKRERVQREARVIERKGDSQKQRRSRVGDREKRGEKRMREKEELKREEKR